MVTQKFLQNLKQGDEETRRQMIGELPLPLDPEIVTTLVGCLSDPSPAVCEAAVDILGNCSDPSCLGLIVAMLSSPNPVERNYVLEIIGKIGNPALPSIIVFMDDPDRNIRKQAIDALTVIASEETFIPLRQVLNDPDSIVASSAAEALGQLGFKLAVPYLEEALKTDNEWMKVAVLTSLGSIGGVEALNVLCNLSNDQPDTVMATVIQAVEHAAEADDVLAVNYLINLLKQEQPKFEKYILSVLEPLLQKNNPLSQAQQQIIIRSAQNILQSPNPTQCATAIKCLSLFSKFEPGELTRFAQSPHSLVRCAALQAMLLTKDIDTKLAASIAMEDREQNEVRIWALRVLAKAPDSKSWMESQLFGVVKSDDIRLRIAAINTLMEWKSENGINAVLELFHDKEGWDGDIFISEFKLDSAALFAQLIEIGFKKLNDPARYRMFQTLCPLEANHKPVLNRSDEYNILLNALQDPYWTIRVHAARLYGERFTENENVLVLMATQDPDERVRATAVNILNDGHKLNQELILLLLRDNSLRVRRAVLMIILELDREQISFALQAAAFNISSMYSGNENNEFTELEREIKRKFLPPTLREGRVPE